jgi:hypothetical protein
LSASLSHPPGKVPRILSGSVSRVSAGRGMGLKVVNSMAMRN